MDTVPERCGPKAPQKAPILEAAGGQWRRGRGAPAALQLGYKGGPGGESFGDARSLARFGQYVVVVKDANGKTVSVSRAETMGEADAARRQLQTPFPASEGLTVGKVLKAKVCCRP